MKNQGVEVVDYLVNISLIDANHEVYSALAISKPKKVWCLKKTKRFKKCQIFIFCFLFPSQSWHNRKRKFSDAFV